MSQIKQTYKAKETEETLDIWFYRPVGFILAKISKALWLSPNAVTTIGMIAGIIAGFLFRYNDPALVASGIALLVFSEAMDSADGQLARMTGAHSPIGRILDGFASNLVFVSVYLNICFRLMDEGLGAWIFAVAVVSGICHSAQSAVADYYRNGYMQFGSDTQKSELSDSSDVDETYRKIKWSGNPFGKFFSLLYRNYTREQEMLSPDFFMLKKAADSRFSGLLPFELKEEYKIKSMPLIKYCNILTTNTRMMALFAALIIGKVWIYFVFEMTVLNLLLFYVVGRQERICRSVLEKINTGKLC